MRGVSAAALLGCLAILPRVAAGAPAVPEPAVIPSPLTLPDAVRLFRERGLDLLIADAAVMSSEGDRRIAGAVANPQLSASYGRSHTFGSCVDASGAPTACSSLPDPALSFGLSDQAALFDWLTGKRGLRVDAAAAALEAARASRADVERTGVAAVKQQFVQTLLAQEALRFAREVAAASGRTLELTGKRYEQGAISEAELARIEVAALETQQAADTAEQALRDARVQLAFLLGARGPAGEFALDAPQLVRYHEPPGLAGAPGAARLLERARERRPDLQAATRQRARAEAALELAKRQRIPDLTLSLQYAQQGTTNQAVVPPTFTLGVSLPLPVFYWQGGEIQKGEADVAAQDLAAARLEAQVASEVEAGLSAYRGTGALVRRMEGRLLERAGRARDLVEVQYRKGAASLLDYLDAQRTYIATNLEYFQDLTAYWTAVFRLEQAIGEELR